MFLTVNFNSSVCRQHVPPQRRNKGIVQYDVRIKGSVFEVLKLRVEHVTIFVDNLVSYRKIGLCHEAGYRVGSTCAN